MAFVLEVRYKNGIKKEFCLSIQALISPASVGPSIGLLGSTWVELQMDGLCLQKSGGWSVLCQEEEANFILIISQAPCV